MKQTEILTHATHVNGWFPAVYMSSGVFDVHTPRAFEVAARRGVCPDGGAGRGPGRGGGQQGPGGERREGGEKMPALLTGR